MHEMTTHCATPSIFQFLDDKLKVATSQWAVHFVGVALQPAEEEEEVRKEETLQEEMNGNIIIIKDDTCASSAGTFDLH